MSGFKEFSRFRRLIDVSGGLSMAQYGLGSNTLMTEEGLLMFSTWNRNLISVTTEGVVYGFPEIPLHIMAQTVRLNTKADA